MAEDPRITHVESAVLKIMEDRLSPRQTALFAGLALSLVAALGAWGWQVWRGLQVTGLNAPVFWGFYIVNFVFFVGVSHAGTLISAILRITDAAFRTPFTRMAEMITIASLPFAATCVIVDLGRPERGMNVILYPHFTSPILWDVVCISTYVIASCLYFYIALIPDLALCRDRLPRAHPALKFFYRYTALGWTNSERQKKRHHRIMTAMSVGLLALVISVHTNVGFIFGMTVRPGWHSTIIGPYFVVGAALQGLGGLGLIGGLLRRFFHLEPWITEYHLNNVRKFTLALVCFWTYFTAAEILTTFYGNEPSEMRVMWSKVSGPYAWSFWGMILGCFIIPFIVLAFQPLKLSAGLMWSGAFINVGMWLERFTIVVPTAATPFLGLGTELYHPSWVEITVTLGWLGGFVLLLLIFGRIFPILTIWEFREEWEAPKAH